MSEPQSSIAKFGVSLVGASFDFSYLDENDEVKTDRFRAHPGLSFDESLEYTRQMALLQSVALLQQRETQSAVKVITDAEDEDGDVVLTALERLAADQMEQARARWLIIVEQVLLLVARSDREKLRPMLDRSNIEDVKALRDYLSALVVDRDKKLVEVAAGVDPTSQKSSTG